jgi:hypothetical protein
MYSFLRFTIIDFFIFLCTVHFEWNRDDSFIIYEELFIVCMM